jgi:CBS domain-containing protein
MLAAGIGALPVVEDDRLVGLLSLVDCLRAYLAWERGVAPAGEPPGPVDAGAHAPQGGRPRPISGRKAG